MCNCDNARWTLCDTSSVLSTVKDITTHGFIQKSARDLIRVTPGSKPKTDRIQKRVSSLSLVAGKHRDTCCQPEKTELFLGNSREEGFIGQKDVIPAQQSVGGNL